jgi:hypothetical protein
LVVVDLDMEVLVFEALEAEARVYEVLGVVA